MDSPTTDPPKRPSFVIGHHEDDHEDEKGVHNPAFDHATEEAVFIKDHGAVKVRKLLFY